MMSLNSGVKRKHPESDICIKLWYWFSCNYPEYKNRYLRFEVGGNRPRITQQILKAEGNKAGVSDIFIALPNKNGGGLWLEVKTKTGKLSQKQKDFDKEMRNDYTSVVAYGYNQCKDEINHYMIACDVSPKFMDL